MSGTSLAKTSSFTQTSVARPQNEIHLFLANNSIKRLPAELFWVQNLTVLSLRGYYDDWISDLANEILLLQVETYSHAFLPKFQT